MQRRERLVQAHRKRLGRRYRRVHRGGGESIVFLWIALLMFITGLALFLLTGRAVTLGLTMLALVIFVVISWRRAHPEKGGNVGHPDINPWTVGR